MEQKDSLKYLHKIWGKMLAPSLKFDYSFKLTQYSISNSDALKDLVFTNNTIGNRVIYTHDTHYYNSMAETVEHRKIRLKNSEDSEEDILTVYVFFVFFNKNLQVNLFF